MDIFRLSQASWYDGHSWDASLPRVIGHFTTRNLAIKHRAFDMIRLANSVHANSRRTDLDAADIPYVTLDDYTIDKIEVLDS